LQVIPRGWVVERLGSGEARRWSKDYERFPETKEAFIYSARLRCLLLKLL
ncbi:MAG: IS5/IS1182 family transposase, partial [Cyanobacteria bacterium SW_6_48_11]